MASALAAIDWAQPWLTPYRAAGQATAAHVAGGLSVAQALQARLDEPPGGQREAAATPPLLQAGPLRFVPADALPAGEAYEAYIARTACVPTRDNLHDFFNGLVWLVWPALKRSLHALQAGQIARHGVGPTRGALRDALTLFDESGAWLAAPAALLEALRSHDWARLFVDGRAAWFKPDVSEDDEAVRLVIVGHALLEQLVVPRKPLCAHVLPLEAARATAVLGGAEPGWSAADFVPKPFLPLPVLGVPGWWPANEQPGFYEDRAVFRPARRAN